ncbi:MAG TPA: hypothetical protein VNB22_19240 [Pyrinomonadaceae bacterium]|jgi:hypothetical protein|nr:hypothetical protein [Pyrinomonadaceae bacterium]
MKNLTVKFTATAAAVFLLLGLFILAAPANAQTRKKKTTKKKTTTTSTVPKPVSPSTLPVIVSQADQYSDQNRQIITGTVETPTENQVETEPETFDEKLSKMSTRMKEMSTRVKTLESSKQNEYDEKQRRLLLNLDILTRAEQRAESLRKQLFELVEKESSIKTKLETIDYDIRPEMIERQVAFAGTMRPEELREMKKKNLESEKRNLESLLIQIQSTKTNLEQNVQKADQLVEKLRAVLEKDIDDALSDQPKEQ